MYRHRESNPGFMAENHVSSPLDDGGLKIHKHKIVYGAREPDLPRSEPCSTMGCP